MIVTKAKKPLVFILFNIFVVALVFILIEGLASTVLFIWKIAATSPVAERSHTQYDDQLGWVNSPNIYVKDMYGPGLYLKTNVQGFRNDQDFSAIIPDHKLRLICSGDSFTLGYGVNNSQTWCQQLNHIDDRLETVNMGQGGYGVDQAYLWYKRDGAQLDHDIHLFAFITHDFERMEQDTFLGYGKPLLTIRDNELIVENVPVPRRAFYLPWLTQNSQAINELKSIQLLSQLFQSPVQAGTIHQQNRHLIPPEIIAVKILRDLQRINNARSSTLVLIYLPTLGDAQPPYQNSTEIWRHQVNIAAQETGINFIDLVEDFRSLSPDQLHGLFIQQGELNYPGAAGHYSAKGNEVVAQYLHEKLIAFPEIAEKLATINQ